MCETSSSICVAQSTNNDHSEKQDKTGGRYGTGKERHMCPKRLQIPQHCGWKPPSLQPGVRGGLVRGVPCFIPKNLVEKIPVVQRKSPNRVPCLHCPNPPPPQPRSKKKEDNAKKHCTWKKI